MSIKKRVAAAACAIMMAASLVACGEDTMTICKSENHEVNAGVYIYYVLNQVNNQMYSIYYSTGKIPEDIVSASYGDGTMTVGEYSEQYAYELCVEMAAIAEEFDRLGLEISKDELDIIKEAVDASWDKEYYEALGIGKSSLEQIQIFGEMNNKVFEAYYLEGGINEVKDDELNKYLSDNYLRFKMISFAKDKDDKGAAAKDKANKYYEMTKEMDFDEVIAQYEADKKAEKEEADKDKDDSSKDDSSATDSSATDSSATDSSATDSSATDSSATDSSEADSSKDDSSSADKKDEEEKEIDNNIMINKKNQSYAEMDVVKHINEKMKNDEIAVFEDDGNWYVLQKLDVLTYTDYIEDNKTAIISEMKTEDFEKLIAGWVEQYDIQQNDKALKRYKAEDIYEDYEDYAEKQQ